jgi:hypothetical protein
VSLPRVTLALAAAGAAVVPASAQAIVQYCTPPTTVAYVCHVPERPGCVHGYVGRLAFETTACG